MLVIEIQFKTNFHFLVFPSRFVSTYSSAVIELSTALTNSTNVNPGESSSKRIEAADSTLNPVTVKPNILSTENKRGISAVNMIY